MSLGDLLLNMATALCSSVGRPLKNRIIVIHFITSVDVRRPGCNQRQARHSSAQGGIFALMKL